MSVVRQVSFCLLMTGLVLVASGCGGSGRDQSIADSNSTNLHRLSNLYVRFQTQHRWNGPKNEAEFKQFINEMDPAGLTRMGVEPGSTDSIFVSEIDNAPFTIRYGTRGSARGSNEAIIFETDGKRGKWRVGFTSSKVEEIEDENRYRGLLDGSLKEPLMAVAPPGDR